MVRAQPVICGLGIHHGSNSDVLDKSMILNLRVKGWAYLFSGFLLLDNGGV